MLVRRLHECKATNGESFADQYRRVAAFLDEIKQKEAENIVVFCSWRRIDLRTDLCKVDSPGRSISGSTCLRRSFSISRVPVNKQV